MSSDLEREIEQTRDHLGETVDALAAKLDVKSRTQDAVREADKRKIATLVGGVVLVVVGAVLLRRRHR